MDGWWSDNLQCGVRRIIKRRHCGSSKRLIKISGGGGGSGGERIMED
jgi:hypothetical protein